MFRNRSTSPGLIAAGWAICLLVHVPASATAGEVRLKNGMVLEGRPAWIKSLTLVPSRTVRESREYLPLLLLETDMQRFFLPRRQVEELADFDDLSRFETFELKQKKSARRNLPALVGQYMDQTPFDEFGRRTITVNSAFGKEVPIIQGITRITPKFLTVVGLTHDWTFGLETTSLPAETLDAMLRAVTDQQDPDDRMAIARFLLQAGLYSESAAELESVIRDFPELKPKVDAIDAELRELQARQILAELRRRRSAGQHRLAYSATKHFPLERLSTDVLQEVRQLISDYELYERQAETVTGLLGELQAQMSEQERVTAAMPLRSIVTEEIDPESVKRLDAFLKSADDTTYSPAEKLALAYSGWVLGSANATPDFDAAVRYWDARFLVLEYLRTENALKRQELLEQITRIEGIGPDRILQLIGQLPPILDMPDIQPGQIHTIEIPTAEPDSAVTYSAILPPEYSPHHRYPLIVALRAEGRTEEQTLRWWAGTSDAPGQAQRHGYIVIAPSYADPESRRYDFDVNVHRIVLESIRDARKRFSVDSDRVFLSGHGMGGDAAFDLGMSHPDLFAGVVPFIGICGVYCNWYWQNAPDLPWYIVGGEFDRDSLARNARVVERMMRHGYDVVYAEYISRGYESYYSEILRIFDWMSRHRRKKYPTEIDAKVLRPSENRFFWLEAEGFPPNVTRSGVLSGNRRNRVTPMSLGATVTEGNTIYVTTASDRLTLWLSPEFVDYDQRLTVKLRGKGTSHFNDFVQPDIGTMLEDLRIRGDRQTLYTARLMIE